MEKELLLRELELFEYQSKRPTIQKFLMEKFDFTGFDVSSDDTIYCGLKLGDNNDKSEFDQCVTFIEELLKDGKLSILDICDGFNHVMAQAMKPFGETCGIYYSKAKYSYPFNCFYTTQGSIPKSTSFTKWLTLKAKADIAIFTVILMKEL